MIIDQTKLAVFGFLSRLAELYWVDFISTYLSTISNQKYEREYGRNKKSFDKVLFIKGLSVFIGGERGIRTLDTLPYTHFPGVRLRPLGHLSGYHFSRQLSINIGISANPISGLSQIVK